MLIRNDQFVYARAVQNSSSALDPLRSSVAEGARARIPTGAVGAGALALFAAVTWTRASAAQTTEVPAGTSPSDLAGTVAAPKAPTEAPSLNKIEGHSLNAAASAGAQWETGNSKIYAATAQGKVDLRLGADDFGAFFIGNYAETYVPGTPAVAATSTAAALPATAGKWQRSTENFQGRLRYERYFLPLMSAFLAVTGTHDRFIALTVRLNVDPGLKVLLIENPATELWAEAGYDFQFDDNYTDANGIEQAGVGGPQLDSSGIPFLISQNDTIHSSRIFVGFHEAFNKAVTLGLGLEYLQGFGGTGGNPPPIPPGFTASTIDPVSISLKAARVNFNALFAASVGGGFSVGFGFNAKYNGQPLPSKLSLDTQGTIALIYALSIPSPKPAASPCPPAPPPPPTTPPPGPRPSAAPDATPPPAGTIPATEEIAPATMSPPAQTPSTASPAGAAPSTMSPPAQAPAAPPASPSNGQ